MGVRTLTRAEVYEKHADELVRFATGLVGPHDSRDIVSAAVVSAMWSQRWASVHNQRAYLYRAVLNEARQQHRRAKRRSATELRAVGATSWEMPEVRPDVLEAVGRLSVSQRAIVYLTYWEDMRPAEVARFLELSDGTVHRQLARAESRLRRILYE